MNAHEILLAVDANPKCMKRIVERLPLFNLAVVGLTRIETIQSNRIGCGGAKKVEISVFAIIIIIITKSNETVLPHRQTCATHTLRINCIHWKSFSDW